MGLSSSDKVPYTKMDCAILNKTLFIKIIYSIRIKCFPQGWLRNSDKGLSVKMSFTIRNEILFINGDCAVQNIEV